MLETNRNRKTIEQVLRIINNWTVSGLHAPIGRFSASKKHSGARLMTAGPVLPRDYCKSITTITAQFAVWH